MPFTMTHLIIAEKIQNRFPGLIHNLPQFYLGSIAPDAVHNRKDYCSDFKKASHLCVGEEEWGLITNHKEWEESLLQFLKRQAGTEYRDFIFGYCSHILGDLYNSLTVYIPLRLRSLEKNLTNFRETYYEECNKVDINLALSYKGSMDFWQQLKQSEGMDLKDLVLKEEMEKQKYNIQNCWYGQTELPDCSGNHTITLEGTMEFIEEAVTFIAGIFKEHLTDEKAFRLEAPLSFSERQQLLCRLNGSWTMEQRKAAKLFDGWEEALIWSCLQGCMGQLYLNDENRPDAALIDTVDFCFLAGRPDRTLLEQLTGFKILIPRTGEWEKLIEIHYGDRAGKFTRYAIKKEPEAFDKEKLQACVQNLESGYTLCMMEESHFKLAAQEKALSDLCAQYGTYENFVDNNALAAVILQGERLVAGASSYAVYREGIEIEIDTLPEYREKGLATACGAKLILECLDRGIYPSWDAHDLRSVHLAEKLGYQLDHPYTAYEVSC